MNVSIKLAIITFSIVCLVSGSFAQRRGRKLPVGAYLKSAKIEILSGDLERYQSAIYMLDSLFLHYGPHAEGLHLMGQIMVDYIDQTPGIVKKTPYVERLVAYIDSLRMCCENKKVKKKYKKDCKKYTTLADSLKVRYWREFYNSGIEQLNRIDELQQEIDDETDSSAIATLRDDIDATADSCVDNLQLAITLDAGDHRGYVGIGSLHEKKNNFEKAIQWLSKGLEKTENRSSLLLTIAYDYIKLNEYCRSIPFFKEYIDAHSSDTITMGNLAICYNNCNFYDSALIINRKILEVAPENSDALNLIGRYYNQIARDASDSASYYQKEDNKDRSKYWQSKREEAFDSSLVYFKGVAELNPEDLLALEQYGTISYIRGNFENAVAPFARLTELEPQEADYWKYLGDCNLNLRKFNEAIAAYEKVTELEPNDLEIWESLKDLYFEVGNKEKQAEADKKIKSLN